jgi:hypothetical protein
MRTLMSPRYYAYNTPQEISAYVQISTQHDSLKNGCIRIGYQYSKRHTSQFVADKELQKNTKCDLILIL